MNEAEKPFRPCVGIMLVNGAGKVWQGRRCGANDDPEGPGAWWQMPQGGIEEGEDIEAAAFRELHEETGISSAKIIAVTKDWHYYDLPPALIPSSWSRPYRGQKQKWVLMQFEGADSEVLITPPAGLDHGAEFDSWRWADHRDLAETVVAFKRPVYVAVIAEFEPLLAGLAD